MAYRQMDIKAPSYLEDFLDQIENLPSQIKSKFAEMRDMEERANSHMADAERAAADSVRKANSKGSGNDSLKKSFQEVIALQGKAVSNANRKVEVAESAFVLVDEVIRNLDEKLREFEAQLRKEGRWPASTADRPPRPSANATLQGGSTPANNASGATGARGLTNTGATTTQKSRRRESSGGRGAGSTGSSHGAGGRSNTKASNTAAAAAAAAAASAPTTPTANVATEQISVIEDMAVDPEEPLYCYCQRVSFGEMVACENNDCPHQWFHFTCVGLTVAPKGQWTCPECSKKM